MTVPTKRKPLAALGAVLVTLVLGGAALAYFGASGSGAGTAAVGTGSGLTIHGSTSGSLYPGASTTINFTADNPSSGRQRLGTIHLASIVACNAAFAAGVCPSGHEVTSCESVETGASDTNTADFWMADAVANQDLASGTGQSVSVSGTLKMNDLSTSQDACQSANLLFNFTS